METKKTAAKAGIGIGIIALVIGGIWLFTRKREGEAAEGAEAAGGAVTTGEAEAAEAASVTTEEARIANLVAMEEAELGRALTSKELHAIETKMTSLDIINEYIIPSGLVTADDYKFWATASVAQKEARAEEISNSLGISVSFAELRDAAMLLQQAEQRAEAAELGIEAAEPLIPMALQHYKAAAAAGSMTFDEYAAWYGENYGWPDWYTEADKKKAYTNLVQEEDSAAAQAGAAQAAAVSYPTEEQIEAAKKASAWYWSAIAAQAATGG